MATKDTIPLTNFAGGLNQGTDPVLIDENQLSDAVNLVPSKLGGVRKPKVWSKDLLRPTAAGADDVVGDVAGVDEASWVQNRLPAFDPIKRVLYLANNTYQTSFNDVDVPYVVHVDAEGNETVEDDDPAKYHRFVPLRTSTADYVYVSLQLTKPLNVSLSEPLSMAIPARKVGNPDATALNAVLRHTDGTSVARISAVSPTNYDLQGTDRLVFDFTPTLDGDVVIVNAGEFYVELTPNSDTDYYELAARPLYRSENILGWSERGSGGTSQGVTVLMDNVDPVITLEADHEPDPNPDSMNRYTGWASIDTTLKRWNSYWGFTLVGPAVIDVNYDTKSVEQTFAEFVAGTTYVDGDVVTHEGTDYTCHNGDRHIWEHDGTDLYAPTPYYLVPGAPAWPYGGWEISNTFVTASVENGDDGSSNGKSLYDIQVSGHPRFYSGEKIMIRGIASRKIDLNGPFGDYLYHDMLWDPATGEHSFHDPVTGAEYLEENGDFAYFSLAIQNTVVDISDVIGEIQIVMTRTDNSNPYMGFMKGVATEDINRVFYFSANDDPAWAASHNLGFTADFSVDDLGSGQTVENQTVELTWGDGTEIVTPALTQDVAYDTDAFVAYDEIAEVMLYQAESQPRITAQKMVETLSTYHPRNKSQATAGLEPVAGHRIRYFHDGSAIWALSGIIPTVNEAENRAHGRLLNGLREHTIPIYAPKFMGEIHAMTTYQNLLVLGGVGGIAVLNPQGLDDEGNFRFQDVMIPDINARLYSVREGVEDVFPPVITALRVFGDSPGRVYAAYGDTLIWSGAADEDAVDDLSTWQGLAFIEFGDTSDEIVDMEVLGSRLLLFTMKGDLYVVQGEAPLDAAVSGATLATDRVDRVGEVSHLATTTIGQLFFATTDGNLWSIGQDLTPQKVDLRIGSGLNIEGLEWDENEQQLWVASGGFISDTYYDSDGAYVEEREDPCSYMWDFKTDSWWRIRNPLDTEAGSMRFRNETWLVGFDHESGEAFSRVDIAGKDRFVTHGTQDALTQPANSPRYQTVSHASLVSKEFNLGTNMEKQVREITSRGVFPEDGTVQVSVLGNDGSETPLGPLVAGRTAERGGTVLARRPVGAIKRLSSFRIKFDIESTSSEELRDASAAFMVRGKAR